MIIMKLYEDLMWRGLIKDISSPELAEKLNMKLTTYWGYENETREMDYSTLIKVANFFNCSIDYLLGRQEMHNNSEF